MSKKLFSKSGVPINSELLTCMGAVSHLVYDYVDSLGDDVDIMELYAVNHVLNCEVDTVLFSKIVTLGIAHGAETTNS
ncbi:MAG: hypothetical protein WDA42_04215 [Candidatus Bathyarchaeia archaeon]|jgi:hypothetical protein